MFPEQNVKWSRKPCFLRYLCLFNFLLLPIFMVVVRSLWGRNFLTLSPDGELFWPGAITHVLLLGVTWLFLNVLFVIWFYVTIKKST